MERKICVIGGGYWGKNHIKTLYEMGNLGGIVETDKDRLAEHLSKYAVQGFSDLEDAIKESFDGYIVATPAITHYPIGKKLLSKGLNVLLEKPMTLSTEHAQELVEIAKESNARLMVGHVLLFHPAIKKIKEIVDSGKLGKLYYAYSNRLNFGKVRTEEDVFWSFAPHDISVLNYLIGAPALEIKAKGSKYLQDNVYDVTMAQFTYPNNVHAHIFVSWLHPFKEQRLIVVGEKGMISFEDSSKDKSIIYYDKHVDFVEHQPILLAEPDEIISYEKKLPLTEELKYFIENLDGNIEIADGKSGIEVVKVLETVQKLIDNEN
jgi:UDP-2-acetamido-3-amino-2,3-dideoxy-glucuronate N-acetyltransferase